MEEIVANVDWIAVIAGTILSFLLGWLWYSPVLFGKKWADGCNIKLATKDSPMPIFPLLVQLIATFLLAWIIGVTASHNTLFTALLILVAISALIAANGIFVKKNTYAILTETTFILAMGVIMIAMNGLL